MSEHGAWTYDRAKALSWLARFQIGEKKPGESRGQGGGLRRL